MVFKNAIIKGDIIDRVGKNAVTVILATGSFLTAYISFCHTQETGNLIIAAVLSLEILALEAMGGRLGRFWKCIPMLHFMIAFLAAYFRMLPKIGSIDSFLYYLLMAFLPIVAVIKMIAIDDSNERSYSSDIRFCIEVWILLDMGNMLAGIADTGEGLTIMMDFISRLSFLGAIMIMYLPKQGLLNIRRIMAATILYSLLATISCISVYTIKRFLNVGDDSHAIMLLTSAFSSLFITVVICTNRKPHALIRDEYEYAPLERVFKAIGWNISEAEQLNRRKYLESAFERDFGGEYRRRLYGDMGYLKDIELIQQRLADIQKSLNAAESIDDRSKESVTELLEIEGADLLGKLNIAYNFDTGISDCPVEILKSDCYGRK